MWRSAQSSEMPAVEINRKPFLLTRSPVSDSDALGWGVAPPPPSGHVHPAICPEVSAESPVVVCPPPQLYTGSHPPEFWVGPAPG